MFKEKINVSLHLQVSSHLRLVDMVEKVMHDFGILAEISFTRYIVLSDLSLRINYANVVVILDFIFSGIMTSG